MVKKSKALSQKLGYYFQQSQLLNYALTHRSVPGNNNERLEFLGDSIVNFVIAKALYELFPTAKEGDLSRIRATLVKGDTLAELAQEFNLGDYLILGSGELKSGGFRRKSILADAMEAIIAAIYLDGGMDACQKCILRWYDSRLVSVTEFVSLKVPLKDPKTRLQELLQKKKLELPIYTITSIKGEQHEQIFHVTCQIEKYNYVTEGIGKSRRDAEQEAAKKYLDHLLDYIDI
ncbi:MAG: Ribonuclease 3 [Legionellaceae bacterium]